jgi:hypothetical protein
MLIEEPSESVRRSARLTTECVAESRIDAATVAYEIDFIAFRGDFKVACDPLEQLDLSPYQRFRIEKYREWRDQQRATLWFEGERLDRAIEDLEKRFAAALRAELTPEQWEQYEAHKVGYQKMD